MSAPIDGWSNPQTAERYADFATAHAMYRRTSADVVARAGLESNSVVVDLCAGTGVTTEALLGALGRTGRVLAVDGSDAMLAQSRSRIDDARVSWIHGRAEELEQLVPTPVDAVVCNSAIWQTDMGSTFAAVRKVLHPGGRFVCNIGRAFLMMPFSPKETARSTPGLMELMGAYAAIDLDYVPPLAARRGGRPMTPDSVNTQLAEAGLSPDAPDVVTYAQSFDEQLAWLRIPIFTERMFPGLDYPVRMGLLDKAAARISERTESASTWVIFSASN